MTVSGEFVEAAPVAPNATAVSEKHSWGSIPHCIGAECQAGGTRELEEGNGIWGV